MPVIAKRFPGAHSVERLGSPVPLPTETVIPPGLYEFHGEILNMTVEGAYQMSNFDGTVFDRRCKIVFGGDVHALMGAISWVTVIGSDHDGAPPANNVNDATYYRPRLLCEATVDFALDILGRVGVTGRKVHVLTAETPTDYYDGHVMIEVFEPTDQTWTLYDPASGHWFGERSLSGVCPLQPGLMSPLCEKNSSVERHNSDKFDPSVWVDVELTPFAEHEKHWRRVLQIPGHVAPTGDVEFYVSPEFADRAAWVGGLAPSYRVVTDEAAWIADYYP